MTPSPSSAPRISVVMCTYNGERFLREQMDSILAQDLAPYEVIVQDDQSADATWSILEEYHAAHPDVVKIFRNPERLGFNANFRTVLQRAAGDFVAISDQDDVWFPQKLRRQAATIGTADCCVSQYYTDPEYRLPLRQLVTPKLQFEHLLFYDCTPGHTMLLRRDFVQNLPAWDDRFFYDWWLSLHAFIGRGIVCTPEPLNWHRHYAGSATTFVARKGLFRQPEHPTWQPYVVGLYRRYRLQRRETWQKFYTYLAAHIDPAVHPTPSAIARLQTRRNPFALLRLSILCARHYREVYPGQPRGIKGRLRAFFYPLLSAYFGQGFFK